MTEQEAPIELSTTQETIRLNDQEIAAVTEALKDIAARRESLSDKKPIEFVLGITADKALLSVDELSLAEWDDERFIVTLTPSDVDGVSRIQHLIYEEVTRYRNGGTTIIPTEFGEIYIPAHPLQSPITLDGKAVTPLADVLPSPEQ